MRTEEGKTQWLEKYADLSKIFVQSQCWPSAHAAAEGTLGSYQAGRNPMLGNNEDDINQALMKLSLDQ